MAATVTVTVYFCVELSAAVTVYSTGLVKFCATPVYGDTLAPVCVMVGTRAVTSVPNGTVRAIVLLASFTVPVTGRVNPLKLKAVIAFAGLANTVTVTVYFCVELSAAVTVYSTGFVKSHATPVLGDTLAPVCVIVGTNAVTSVAYGTVKAIVLLASFTVPVTGKVNPLKLKAVIAFAGFAATVTVTVYVCVELSAAVTVYITGFVKSRATPVFGEILAPVCVIVGTNAVTSVPYGTVKAIVLLTSFTIPVTFGINPLKLKAVISLAGLLNTPPLCPTIRSIV